MDKEEAAGSKKAVERVEKKADAPPPDIIESSIGSFGRWHCWVVIWAAGIKFSIAWHQMAILFHAPKIDFNCTDPGLDKCAPNCSGHEFDRSVFKETITTQWDLVCDRFQYNNITQMIVMIGILLGNLVFGFLSDRFGRKIPLVAAVILQTTTGCASAYVPWFWLHLVLRFLCTTATGGTMITSFVLVMEVVGVKWRTTVGILYQLPFNLGNLILPLFGYLIRDWRHNQFTISITSVVFIFYWWVLPESPRFLLTVGKTEKAIECLERAATRNRRPTESIRPNVIKYVESQKFQVKKGGNVLLLFKTPNVRIRTLCIFYNWAVFGLCFFGLNQYLGELGGNLFVKVAISGAVQVPGTLTSIWALRYLGRKLSLIIANIIAGVATLIIAILILTVSKNVLQWLKPALAIVAVFGLSINFCAIYIYAGELFPTIIRNVGCGLSSVCARIGSLCAPFVAKASSNQLRWVAPLIFGVTALIGAVLCLFLPETRNCKLPDTIEEAEQFGTKPKEENK